MRKKNRFYLVGVVLTVIAGIVSLSSLDGKEFGLASLLTVFFTGFTAGATLTAYISERRKVKNKRE